MRTFNSGYLNTRAFYATKSPIVQILFPADWPSYYSGFTHSSIGLDPSTNAFTPLRSDQQAAVRLALSSWSNYVKVTFTDEGVADGKKVSFGFTPLRVSGVGYYPVWSPAAIQGDVFFSADVKNEPFTPTSASPLGRSNFWLALHEVGHALGLDHDQSGTRNGGSDLPAGEDNTLFTVMSYNDYAQGTGRRAITPMLYDIKQLQDQYGAQNTYNATDTTYTFTDTVHPFTAGGITVLPSQALMTLWDGGGKNDVIDASGVTTNVKLDLREGEFSAIGTNYTALKGDAEKSNPAFNVGIAFDTEIENAKGGSGDDTLIGNDLANKLEGGAGTDTYIVGKGGDTVKDDAAGKGSVSTADNYVFTGGSKKTGNSWESGDGRVTYVKNGSNLVIVKDNDLKNATTIQSFDFAMANKGSYLGISLPDKNDPKNNRKKHTIADEVEQKILQAILWVWPKDPLVLDLDGDGVELTDSNSTALFDHNADNIKTGTQWAKSDDGMLVRDVNGNGVIDSGRARGGVRLF